MHQVVIDTERLQLRPLTIADAQAVFAWVSDERVTRYMVYTTYETVAQVVEWLRCAAQSTEEYHFGFVRKADGLLIGSGSIGPGKKKEGFWEFGYNFRQDCWGNGYGTEAAKAMIQYAYDRLGARKFCAQHALPNRASGRVMEKCGLHFVGYGQFRKLDGSEEMPSAEYEMELE